MGLTIRTMIKSVLLCVIVSFNISKTDCILTSESRANENCPYSKKVVLEVSGSGLGNRLLSIISTSLLSTFLERELELTWNSHPACPTNWTKLFVSPPSLNYQKATPNATLKTRCFLELSQKNSFRDFRVIQDEKLMALVNNKCEIIHIRSNQFFAPMVLHKLLHLHNPVVLHSYYHSLANCLFRPRMEYLMRAEEVIKRFEGQKYLSIHARSYYDDGKNTKKVLDCAKRFLEDGHIKYVYIATDNLKFQQMATTIIGEKRLVLTKKELLPLDRNGENETWDMRQDMTSAMVEWLVIGKADYCMSSTMFRSTFSQTAIGFGTCHYIHMHNCESANLFMKKRTTPHIPHMHIMQYINGNG